MVVIIIVPLVQSGLIPSHSSFPQVIELKYRLPLPVCQWCARFFREGVHLARKTGQIVGCGRQRWLVRVFLGRDRETRKRRSHSRIVRRPLPGGGGRARATPY